MLENKPRPHLVQTSTEVHTAQPGLQRAVRFPIFNVPVLASIFVFVPFVLLVLLVVFYVCRSLASLEGIDDALVWSAEVNNYSWVFV